MKTLKSIFIMRWGARVGSTASIGFLSAFLLGEGLPPLMAKTVLFPFGVMLGLVLGWRYEAVGGGIAALSVLAFYALEYMSHGRFPKGPWFLLIAAPSLIFILCGTMRARMADEQATEHRR